MKKKRITLHVCILLLAIVCMAAGMYVCYWCMNDYTYDVREVYNQEYSYDVASILEYSNAQKEYREKFADENKVLIKNKELGNVTVLDIKEIFNDKYFDYYNDEYGMDFSDYDEYEQYYEYEYNEYMEDAKETLYDIDVSFMNKYKKDWQEDRTDASKEKYLYYKDKCAYVDEYAELVEILMLGVENDGNSTERYGETKFLLNETYPVTNTGMLYYIKYSLGGKSYTISNVGSEDFFKNDKNDIADITVLNNGTLTQDNPVCGQKNLEEYLDDSEDKEFLSQADKMYVAIYTADDSTHYQNCLERIERQPKDVEIETINRNFIICVGVIVVTIIVAFILYIILMVIAGHKNKGDKPQLSKSDKLWWDVEFVIGFFVFCTLLGCLTIIEAEGYYKIFAICTAVAALPAIEFVVLISESLMRRLKTKSFMQTTLFGKVCKLIRRLAQIAKICCRKLYGNISLTWKVIVLGAVLFFGQFMTIVMTYGDMEFTALGFGTIVILLVCYMVWRYFSETQIIEDGTRKISEGDINFEIEEKMKFRVNESLRESVNGIGDGLNNAVAANLKNERMKTELITNVSHDLKTPLTSIINYVDLLKTEGLDSENAGKYLEVLDQKSQRLKHLTEDLVEASKLNSGAITLEREKLDIVQLVNQSLGEYDEKFRQKKLHIIKSVQEEPIWVMADGRKTWRLFDNLYNNVYKYAMAGTRVYVDIKKESSKVVVSIKNISENPLNFSADELMERFVRGDVSRTTEGSGLGLSIARSIAERHGGAMNIVLDGDLFKVEMKMDLMHNE